jgi:hypothetical protein
MGSIKRSLNEFEFVIPECPKNLDFQQHDIRLKAQNDLIAELNKKNLCYTSGLAETLLPRFQGKLPSKAGVFFFHCKDNNSYYYGHTAQTQGISGRVKSMKAALRRGQFANGNLQADWDQYGEGSFEIEPYNFGDSFVDETKRINLVNQLIASLKSDPSKGTLYNFTYAAKNKLFIPITNPPPASVDLSTPLPPKQSFEQNTEALTYYPPLNLFPNGKPIYLGDRKPIIAEGKTYLSVKEAAALFNVNWNVIKSKVDKGNTNYRLATNSEIQQQRSWPKLVYGF